MKNAMKRTVSLLLSAVLLLSNVPFGALATEDVVGETVVTETQAPVTQPAETQPVQITTMDTVTNDVANEQTITYYDVYVNGTQVTSQNASNILGDGKVSYANGTLTLNNATINAQEPNTAIDARIPLTIELKGTNTLTSQGQYPAIYAYADLTIQGTGSLTASTPKGAVIHVAGVEDTSGNKKGLTIQGDVTVSAMIEDVQTSVGIGSPKGVIIGEGKVHLMTNCTGSEAYQIPAGGYTNIGQNGFATGTSEWTADGSALEFVAATHLSGEWTKTDSEHYKTCADTNCPLGGNVKIDLDAHDTTAEANCQSPAICKDCDTYGEKDMTNHTSEETEYKINENGTHLLVHAACQSVYGNAVEEPHNFVYTCAEGSAVVTKKCAVCPLNETTVFEVKAPAVSEDGKLIWDNNAKAVTVSPEGTQCVIVYYKDTVSEETKLEGAPREPGKYTAVVTVVFDNNDENNENDTYMPQVEYTIEKKPLADTMISKIENKEYSPSSGLRTEPNFTVSDSAIQVEGEAKGLEKDTDYTVTYKRDGTETTDFTNAGEIEVIITAAETSQYYTGTAKTEYEITKIDVPADAFEPVLPEANPVYDGTKKTLNYNSKSGYTAYGIGEPNVVFYQTIEGKETKVDAIDAGTYTVKIEVAASNNYKEALLDASWTLTIEPTNQYEETTKKTSQTIGEGVGEFVPPSFTGVTRAGSTEPEAITGKTVYTYNGSQTTEDVNALKAYLNGLADGAEETITYTFTPDAKGNYTESKNGTITVKNVNLTFKMDNGTAVTAEKVKKSGTITYGDTDIVDTSKLVATANGATGETGVGFTVKYAKMVNGTPEETKTDDPNAGSSKFYVYYNGTLGNVDFADVLVCSGDIYVEKKTPTITGENKPKAEILTEDKDGAELPLLTEENKGKSDDGLALVYCLTESGTYSTEIPKVSEAGRYDVWYCTPADDNHNASQKGKIQVIVAPYLTAIYDQTLADVEIPEDGKWKWALNDAVLEQENLSKHDVGPYGINDDFQMVYDNSAPFTVKINVGAKTVANPVIDAATYIHYDERDHVAVKVYDPMDASKDDDNVEIPAGEYEAKVDAIDSRTGWTTITVKDKADGNYAIATETKNVLIYRPYHVAFTALQNDDDEHLKDTAYDTVAKVKAELNGKIKADEYPEGSMKHFKIMMTYDNTPDDGKENWIATRKLEYYPKGGFTIVVPYSVIGSELGIDDDYKVSIMDAATSTDLETKAGDPAVEIADFKKTEEGIQFHSDGYSIVCIAPKVDLTKEYSITKSIVYDSKTSTKGTLTIKVDSKTADKATYGKTVEVTASASNGYSIQSVKVTDASGNTVDTDQSGTKYTFKMPASNVTVKLTLKKTASSSKNPSSGDTSNIYFWIGVMVVSGAGMAAMVFKRKKK